MTHSYLEIEVTVAGSATGGYQVAVVRSPAGEARETVALPFDRTAFDNLLLRLENAILGGRGRRLSTAQLDVAEELGTGLFNMLFHGRMLTCFDVSLREAEAQDMGLRVKLRIDAADLLPLPWEFLFDPRTNEFLSLSTDTPLVRYLELPRPPRPLAIVPPLRILGMVASPDDLPPLDLAAEQRRVEQAIDPLRDAGLAEITWIGTGSLAELQRALRTGSWHIFHFIGHGVLDPKSDEGHLAFRGEFGETVLRSAGELGILLRDHRSLRLAVLNACEGARSGEDVMSSTAAVLVSKGIPAVLAMQYEISDRAAREFAREFYTALTDGAPIDAALAEARKALRLADRDRLEWGTPVLYMRSRDGVLFDLATQAVAATRSAAVPVPKDVETIPDEPVEPKLPEPTRGPLPPGPVDHEDAADAELLARMEAPPTPARPKHAQPTPAAREPKPVRVPAPAASPRGDRRASLLVGGIIGALVLVGLIVFALTRGGSNPSATSTGTASPSVTPSSSPSIPVATPVRAPVGLSADAKAFAVTLSWQAAIGGGPLTDYGIYRDGGLVSRTTETTFVDDTAEPGSHYTYEIRAQGSSPTDYASVFVPVSTPVPSDGDARLEGEFALKLKVTAFTHITSKSEEPENGYFIGKIIYLSMTFTPECETGPCQVAWADGTYPKMKGDPLKRNGAKYSGVGKGGWGFTCSGTPVTTNLTYALEVTKGTAIDREWRASRLKGTITLVNPSGDCNEGTATYDIVSGTQS